jgi:hypothetical protein
VVGTAPDLGAFEWGVGAGALLLTTSTTSLTAGGDVSVTVAAVDSSGKALPSYAGTVHLSSSDPQAGLPADYTFSSADHGVHTFWVTLTTATNQSITASDTTNNSVCGTAHVSVQPAPASAILVIARPSTVVNYAFPIGLVAEDSFGNTATSYAGTLHLSSSDHSASLPADYTFKPADQGTHLFNVTFATGGTQSLTATDVANPSLAGTATIAVSGVTHFAIAVPAGTVAGTPFNFTVTALDQSGKVVSGYTGTVHFTITDSYVLPPADYVFVPADHGVHTFTMAFHRAGTQTITVRDTTYGAITGAASILVSPSAAAGFQMNGPTTVTAGTPFSIQLVAVDRYGNTVTSYAGTIHFASTDPAAALPPDYAFTTSDQGAHTFTVLFRTTGTKHLRVTSTDGTIWCDFVFSVT